MKYNAAVVGGAGYAGIELTRLLTQHPDFTLTHVASDSNEGRPVAEMYPAFVGGTSLAFCSTAEIEKADVDVVFLAVPHTVALALAPGFLKRGVSVVDLSADFRLKDAKIYEQYYGVAHTAQDILKEAAFGLPELFPDALSRAAAARKAGDAVLVACAGCYPTATSLAAAPALRAGCYNGSGPVVVDAISGVTGAGKKPTERTHFCSSDENAEAYGLITHRHTPEIEQILGIAGRLVFTPHLVPMRRGLLSTVSIPIDQDCEFKTTEDFQSLYANFYQHSAFVRVLPACATPRTSSVVGTNNAHVGVAYNPAANVLIAVCAIDNLCKGAAGQAVQCANQVFGLDESAGLGALALAV